MCSGMHVKVRRQLSRVSFFSYGFQGFNLALQHCTAKAFIDGIFLVLTVHCNWDEELSPCFPYKITSQKDDDFTLRT